VSFTIEQGETFIIMGGSGCGKTTLLKCLNGMEKPDRGSIRIDGQDIVTMRDDELYALRTRWGMCFQMGALFNSLSVGENIALPMREHTRMADNIIDIMVRMKLDMVGLTGFQDFMPSEISGGMKRRVALARAIALDPKLVFYDEPGTGLDPIVGSVIYLLIRDLAHKMKMTSVVVTHEMEFAFRIADRMAMLHEGKIVKVGTPDEFRASDDPLIKQFINGLPDGPIPLRRSREDYLEFIIHGDNKV
ncbi:MAG TPA: ABC transporter ATP-binding protein, partial [bacterium]|nr:ABC transporter ATP-binding protein [bacterium]